MMEGSRESNNNIHSFLDKQAQRQAEKRAEFYAENPDVVDTSQFRDPERVREESCDTKAVLMLKLLSQDSRFDHTRAMEIRGAMSESAQELRDAIDTSSHQSWMQDPIRFWAIADAYLSEVDSIAENIVNEDIRSRFPRQELDAKARAYTIAQTPFLIKRLRAYDRGEVLDEHHVDTALEYRRRRANNDWDPKFESRERSSRISTGE